VKKAVDDLVADSLNLTTLNECLIREANVCLKKTIALEKRVDEKEILPLSQLQGEVKHLKARQQQARRGL